MAAPTNCDGSTSAVRGNAGVSTASSCCGVSRSEPSPPGGGIDPTMPAIVTTSIPAVSSSSSIRPKRRTHDAASLAASPGVPASRRRLGRTMRWLMMPATSTGSTITILTDSVRP